MTDNLILILDGWWAMKSSCPEIPQNRHLFILFTNIGTWWCNLVLVTLSTWNRCKRCWTTRRVINPDIEKFPTDNSRLHVENNIAAKPEQIILTQLRILGSDPTTCIKTLSLNQRYYLTFINKFSLDKAVKISSSDTLRMILLHLAAEQFPIKKPFKYQTSL